MFGENGDKLCREVAYQGITKSGYDEKIVLGRRLIFPPSLSLDLKNDFLSFLLCLKKSRGLGQSPN